MRHRPGVEAIDDFPGRPDLLEGNAPARISASAASTNLYNASRRAAAGDAALDLVVPDDPPLMRVHQEHPPRLEAAHGADALGENSTTPTSLASTTSPSVVTT